MLLSSPGLRYAPDDTRVSGGMGDRWGYLADVSILQQRQTGELVLYKHIKTDIIYCNNWYCTAYYCTDIT